MKASKRELELKLKIAELELEVEKLKASKKEIVYVQVPVYVDRWMPRPYNPWSPYYPYWYTQIGYNGTATTSTVTYNKYAQSTFTTNMSQNRIGDKI